MKTDKSTLFEYCTTVCSQNINRQVVNKADENPRIIAFLVYLRILNLEELLKQNHQSIPMLIGTSCIFSKCTIQHVRCKFMNELNYVFLVYVLDFYTIFYLMLGTFPKGFYPSFILPMVFSQVATYQMCNFPSGNFPSLS